MGSNHKILIANCNQKMIAISSITDCMDDWRHLDEPWDRLRWARRRRGYETARDAARAMGTKEATYGHHENGTAGFSHVAVDYADFYRVNLIWLLAGRGSPEGTAKETYGPSPIEKIFQELPADDQAKLMDYGQLLRGRKEP